MRLKIHKIVILFLSLMLFVNSIPLRSYAAQKLSELPEIKIPQAPYTVQCEDILQVLQAGQLEKLILSTERPEAELVQILTDNFLLMSPLFIKSFMVEILPQLQFNGVGIDTSNLNSPSLLRKIAKKILRLSQVPLTNSQIERIFDRMELFAAIANQNTHLIVKRALDAVRSSEINKDLIYNIYRKTAAQVIARIGHEYALKSLYRNSETNYGILPFFMPSSVFIGSAGIAIPLLIEGHKFLAAASFFLINAANAYYTFQNLYLKTKDLKKKLDNVSDSKNRIFHPYIIDRILIANNLITGFFQQDPPPGHIKSVPYQKTGPYNLSDRKIRDLSQSQLTITDAAYMGYSDIVTLNEHYTRLNESFKSFHLESELQEMRAAAQKLLETPDSQERQIHFNQQMQYSLEVLRKILNAQNKEIWETSNILETLHMRIQSVTGTLHIQPNTESDKDDLKKQILLARFEAELKRLKDQTVHLATLNSKSTQNITILRKLETIKSLSEQTPMSPLEWEEAAKNTLLNLNEILSLKAP